jgi:predicted DNA repair protein MutK
MPPFLSVLSIIGTLAMLWVGGGIIVHGLEEYGFGAIGHGIDAMARPVAAAMPFANGMIEWLAKALGAGLFGLVVGGLVAPVALWIIAPLAALIGRAMVSREPAPGS